MIITEFMENGSLDTFLKVSHSTAARPVSMLPSVSASCVITAFVITLIGVLNAFYTVLWHQS